MASGWVPKPTTAAAPARIRRGGEPREVRIVAVQHGDATGFEPEKDFGLGIGDRLDRREKAEMGRLDRGDHRDVRPHQLSENGYLARMVHAQLENAVLGIGRQPGERQRRTPMIVEAACGSEGWAAGGERQAQRLLGAGLADTAGNRKDPGAAAFARRRAEGGKAGERISHAQQRRRRRQIRDIAIDHRRSGTALKRGTDEIMSVMVRPAQCYEEVTRGETAGIDRDARRRPRPCARSAGRSCGICGGPQRCHREIRHAQCSGPDRTISRAIAASSKG